MPLSPWIEKRLNQLDTPVAHSLDDIQPFPDGLRLSPQEALRYYNLLNEVRELCVACSTAYLERTLVSGEVLRSLLRLADCPDYKDDLRRALAEERVYRGEDGD